MKLYKIIAFDEKTGQAQIQVEGKPVMMITIPINEKGNLIEGNVLDDYLKTFVTPAEVVVDDRLSRVRNLNKIKALVEPVKEVDAVLTAQESLRLEILNVLLEEGLIK